MLDNYQKDRLLAIADRCRSEAIRREHDMAEALIATDWYALRKHQRAAIDLHDDAAVCVAAVRERS